MLLRNAATNHHNEGIHVTQTNLIRPLRSIQKPGEGEYAPYAIMYVRLVPDDGLVLQHMRDQAALTTRLLGDLPEATLSMPCAEGEWTIKQILAHVIDAERVFAYRALRFARNDLTALPGFDQEADMRAINAAERTIEDLLEEYNVVRMSSVALFNSLPADAFERIGVASNNPLSVRGAVYFIAGHELHHLNSIRENYLQAK
jgi:uncharacterized damage-inducible protein DinB